MEFALVGGYDAAFMDALSRGSTGAGGIDLSSYGVGSTTLQGLATGADANYTNQYVNNGLGGYQTNGGTQLLGSTTGTATIPDTRVMLPPLAQGQPAPAPAPQPATVPAPAPAPKRIPVTYTVKSGDNLSKIAEQQGLQNWQQLYNVAENKKVIGSNPNLIHPGQQLTIPGKFIELPADPAPTGANTTPNRPNNGGTAAPAPVVTPAPTAAGSGQPPAQVQEMLVQLRDIDAMRVEGRRLLTEFYAQLQYVQSYEARTTIEQSIEQTRADNYTLDQIRLLLVQQLGPYAPQEDAVSQFLDYGLGATL